MSQTWTALAFVIHGPGGSNGPRTPYSCNRPTSASRETGHQSSPCLKNPQRHGDYKTLSELSTRASFPAPWRIFPLEDEGDILASMTL